MTVNHGGAVGSLMNSQKLKCLFGYHKFDELWHSTPQYNSIVLCSNCRTVGKWVSNRKPYSPWSWRFFKIEETSTSLIAKPSGGFIYIYSKIGHHLTAPKMRLEERNDK